MEFAVPTSLGDALDRLSILRIKERKILDASKRANVTREATAIRGAWLSAGLSEPETQQEFAALEEVNEQLWEIEDQLRALEAASEFGPSFVALARSVYFTNDRRAALKRAVNLRLGSSLVEEKQHPSYSGIEGVDGGQGTSGKQ